MMKALRNLTIGALLLCTPLAAQARDWPSAGGWDVAEMDDFCFMTQEYEGPGDSRLTLAMYTDGRVFVSDTNAEWSAEEGRTYEDVAFALDDDTYGGGKVVGLKLLGQSGFIGKMGEGFLTDFAKAGALHIYKGDTKIDRLSLTGTTLGLATLRRCVSSLQAAKTVSDRAEAAAERERRRFADLPKDPFAGK